MIRVILNKQNCLECLNLFQITEMKMSMKLTLYCKISTMKPHLLAVKIFYFDSIRT